MENNVINTVSIALNAVFNPLHEIIHCFHIFRSVVMISWLIKINTTFQISRERKITNWQVWTPWKPWYSLSKKWNESSWENVADKIHWHIGSMCCSNILRKLHIPWNYPFSMQFWYQKTAGNLNVPIRINIDGMANLFNEIQVRPMTHHTVIFSQWSSWMNFVFLFRNDLGRYFLDFQKTSRYLNFFY